MRNTYLVDSMKIYLNSASESYISMMEPLRRSAVVARNVAKKMGVFDSYLWVNSSPRNPRWPDGLKWVPYVLGGKGQVPVFSLVDGVLHVAGFPVDDVFVESAARDVAALSRKMCADYLIRSLKVEDDMWAAETGSLQRYKAQEEVRFSKSAKNYQGRLNDIRAIRDLNLRQRMRLESQLKHS